MIKPYDDVTAKVRAALMPVANVPVGAAPIPFIPIIGGKGRHAPMLASWLPQGPALARYCEPFVGGGALFFWLVANGRVNAFTQVTLADKDRDLIALYAAVRDDAAALHAAFTERCQAVRDQPGDEPEANGAVYYTARDAWNTGRDRSPVNHLFLRCMAYNGLWRISASGNMNAPYRGKLRGPTLARLAACAAALRGVVLVAADFREWQPGLFDATTATYFDPPYFDAQDKYVRGGFTPDDHRALIDRCGAIADTGATVLYSNHDRPFVREQLAALWPAAVVHAYGARRNVNRDSTKRGEVGEILAVGRRA